MEHCLREDLNESARRVMVVLHPIRLVITNYPEGKTETFEVENNPNRPQDGSRTILFSRELFIERDDFMETPAKGYFRFFPGNEVRLKSTYIVRCTGCKKDADGNVTEVYATYDPQSRGGNAADGRKVRGTVHWVDAQTAVDAQVRLYESLFTVPDPDAGDKNFLDYVNPQSLTTLDHCKAERSVLEAAPLESFQFMRLGYFCLDSKDTTPQKPVFNRSVSLKDGFKGRK